MTSNPAFLDGTSSMSDDHSTTATVQRYLDALAGDTPADPIIRALLDRAVRRLELLCANMLYRRYPRLTQPPLNLQPDEILGAVVERLLKAMRAVRPRTVREFFGLANQHMRWELDDLARRLDERPASLERAKGSCRRPPALTRRSPRTATACWKRSSFCPKTNARRSAW